MMERKPCECKHLWNNHGFTPNENNVMKRPCNECDCKHFRQPGTPTPEARAAPKWQIIQEQKKAEETRKKAEEMRKKAEEITEIKRILQRKTQCTRKRHCSGLYYGINKFHWKHNAHRLSILLYQNKRFRSGPLLAEEEINEICDQMYITLKRESTLDNIEIIVPVPNDFIPQRPEPRCAPPIVAGLAAIICKRENRKNCNSYNDVLVRVSHTRHTSDSPDVRQDYTKNDYDIAEYIKTAENNRIKDQTVLLIDDITTTGVTVDVCAKLLEDYGAKEVIILCAALTYIQ